MPTPHALLKLAVFLFVPDSDLWGNTTNKQRKRQYKATVCWITLCKFGIYANRSRERVLKLFTHKTNFKLLYKIYNSPNLWMIEGSLKTYLPDE